ncbi:cell division protein FtsZ [Hirschia litorea]|uniref:Cell division protein FtsZ n=1 Tax=Hirschia litorea TaxID=1199156 RepID=A0ABW2IM28_9PROT
MPVELKPRIIVFGVGGAGGNAVNNMIQSKLQGVEFIVANTDSQALLHSQADHKVQLGMKTTEGLGAGAKPSVGAESAEESIDEIKKQLEGAHMAFIAAGMGGGTGTGAAPVIARIAKEMGVLTVGVVTKPFDFEGKRRMTIADEGVQELRNHVDTLIIIPNQNLFRIANANTTFADAFTMADEVLYQGVRGVTDLMVMPGLINLDFADVRTVMSGMEAAMMGTGEAAGEQRALKAAQAAIANPLLDDVSMKGAKGVLINITGGYDMTLYEVDEAANEVRKEVDPDAQIILGSTFDHSLEGKIRVSVVATGISYQAAGGDSAASARPFAQPVVKPSEPTAADAISAALDAEPALPEEDLETEEVAAETASHDEDYVAPPIINRRPSVHDEEPESAVEAEDADDDTQYAVEPEESEPPQEERSSKGRSSLFGWGKGADADKASSEDGPKLDADEYEDDELEIPAFLRRSANN